MFNKILFHKIDNSQIIVFRILFGLLMMADAWGAIATGWVKETFVDPDFTFTFIGFQWTQFLIGETMYMVYGVLGFLGLMVALGAIYRLSALLLALGWSLVYFMQKEHYNNHYYLLMLVAWFMVFIRANRYKSVDVLIWPQIRQTYTYFWTQLLFILQIFIVYFFAAIAKLYPGWLNGDFLQILYRKTAQWANTHIQWEPLTQFLYSTDFAKSIAWIGFGFDLLIVPLLLWKRTRVPAFLMALIFHIINSLTLHIGVFPYFALALTLFCFPPELIRKAFFPKKAVLFEGGGDYNTSYKNRSLFSFVFILYIAWQIYLPLRHWAIPGDVLWTEEGHRLSWRMMLRSKSASTQFYMVDKKSGERSQVRLNEYLTPLQISRVGVYPDFMWQFAQQLKKIEAEKNGRDVAVFVTSKLSINGSSFYDYIDQHVDLTSVKWKYFGHQEWILPEPKCFSCFHDKNSE
ncbi:MAG: HTTM domain-containing protein [Weeksellaceae bacterium]